MSSEAFSLRWGILATGGIAKTFTKDLLVDPTTRDAGDIRHIVAAAASSTSASRAQDFLNEVKAPSTAKAFGSYKELVNDKDVDIIYVATPHSHHYQHTRLALEAGKHVLVEKPITVNAEQCRILRDLAKEKKRFLMEAVWTRFFPLSREVTEFIRSGQLGDVKRVFADFSFWNDAEKEFGTKHRMVNLDLAGGALLDLGIYSLTWVFMILYHAQGEGQRGAPHVSSAVTKYELTGADETTTMLLKFPTGAHGVAGTSIQVATTPNPNLPSPDAIRIQGTLGDLTIDYAPRPRSYTLTPASSASRGTPAEFEHATKSFPIPGGGHGMFWEADECARCVRDGRLQSEVIPLEETEQLMRVMDQVRKQSDLVYPERIGSVEYPLEGFGL
ncbi:hypothetical protein BKA66DRAFT_257704 [Pyrenochaeta sp. MPI-SDFR-AT-0127]|nr:hypothetical protein BKA66DRAFT_257704 [Pyrenochaeta sp. MPI-SDFR-AT-0127]